ncbi:MAG: FtsX-like permease family protein [Alphaproteobacteria bacterium]|nr:FtsX-like permease family protein [Alphaproteobacteria bacterium]
MTSRGLVWKNLFRKKLRTFLTLFAIFVAFLLYGVLMAFQATQEAPTQGPLARRLVVTNKINFTQPLPISYVDKIRALPEVKRASHMSWFGGYYREPQNFLIAFAVDEESFLDVYSEFELPPEQRAAFLKDRQGIVIGKRIADSYGFKVGDHIPLRSNLFFKKDGGDTYEFNVSGIIVSPENLQGEDQVAFHYAYFNEARAFGQDSIGQVIVETNDPAQNDAVAQKIDAMFVNSANETETRSEAVFQAAFAEQAGNIGLIITFVVGAAFVTILLIAGNTMMLAVRERTGEIGVLKTIGFTAQRIFAMVLSESMLFALIGGLLGLAAAAGASAYLGTAGPGFIAGMKVTPGIALSGLGLMLLLGLVTGAVPAWNAMRTDIITAFARK